MERAVPSVGNSMCHPLDATRRKMHKGGPLMAFVRAFRRCNSRVFAVRHLLAVAVAGITARGAVETGEEYGIFQAH